MAKMYCDKMQERIQLAAYGELEDVETHELELHLASCALCREEQERMQALKVLASLYAPVEPDANLIARARLRLSDALDQMPAQPWHERLRQKIQRNLMTAPVAATVLMLAGVSVGAMLGYAWAARQSTTIFHVTSEPMGIPTGSGIRAITVSDIQRAPNSEQVEVHYNQVVPRSISGSLDDPAVRQLLMLASTQNAAEDLRGDSVDLLATECEAHHSCNAIRDALMVALRYDKSARVRARALRGLAPYIADDMRVRNAVLEAVLSDPDARVRTDAIGALEPVGADTSVRQALSTVATQDNDAQIRLASRNLLTRVPEIQ